LIPITATNTEISRMKSLLERRRLSDFPASEPKSKAGIKVRENVRMGKVRIL